MVAITHMSNEMCLECLFRKHVLDGSCVPGTKQRLLRIQNCRKHSLSPCPEEAYGLMKLTDKRKMRGTAGIVFPEKCEPKLN